MEKENDSLFEGMVLFDPSEFQFQINSTDIGTGTADDDPKSNDFNSEPLDENLFSDLTLVMQSEFQTQIPASISIETAAAADTNHRQISSRRKRRPGLRIGYGRDPHPDLHSPPGVNDDDDTSSPIQSLQQHHISPSPDFNLDQINLLISDKLNRARNSVSTVSASRKDAIRTRRIIMDNLNLSSLKYSHLEKQLEEACESEDFDTAERLSDTLASAETEKQAFLTQLKDADVLCDAMDSRMQLVLDFLIATEEECHSLLLNFATDAENEIILALKTAEAESAKELEKWHLSKEVLEAKKMEIEIESHVIHESRMVLNASVDLLVEDDKIEKGVLYQKKLMLTDELEKLLALVEEKKREIEENDSVINTVEKRISDAISSSQNVQANMDAKYDALQSTLSQMQLQSQALSVKRREIDEFLTLAEDKGAKLKKIAQLCAEDAEKYRQVFGLRKFLMSSISKTREEKATLSQTEEELSKDVQILQQEFHSARASLQELSSKKSIIQQDIESSKQRSSFIEKRVPELEAEKKVATGGRNFKEAARVAAEAKSLSNEKNSICTDIDRALLELEKLEEETKGTMNWLQKNELLIQSKENELAKARFQRLLLTAGTAAAEGTAALELGNTEEGNLLFAEAEATRCEAKKLQPLYNFREDEFANIPKHFISMELVFNLGHKKLADMVASFQHANCDN